MSSSLSNLLVWVKNRLDTNRRLLMLLPRGQQYDITAARQQSVFDATLLAAYANDAGKTRSRSL